MEYPNSQATRHTWRSLQSFRAGETISIKLNGSGQPLSTLTEKSQDPATHQTSEVSFPFRTAGWQLDQPSARDTEERLAVATLAADIGIWDLDVRSDSFQWCFRCAKIFGIPLAPKRWLAGVLELIHPEDRGRVQLEMEKALDPGGSGLFDSEYRILRPNGEVRWIASNGRAFFQNLSGVPTAIRFLGTLLDRTEQKLAHRALLESEKLAMTGRLAVSIAHEIKNPLDSISNLLYIVRDERSAEKRREYLSLAESELLRLNEISSNTLRFYREPVDSNSFDVADLIESVLVLFRGRIAPQKIRVQTELQPGIAVEAPEGELRQVIVNLVGNAIDAMSKGGRLIIRSRELRQEKGHRCVRLTVADTGTGMPPEVVARVFEAFYTTKKNTGTGIGLWISQEIIKKSGSKIRVKSTLGRGTVFSLYLRGTAAPTEEITG